MTHPIMWISEPTQPLPQNIFGHKSAFFHGLMDLGGMPSTRPLKVKILSFQHTKFSKCNRLGSRHPPCKVDTPLWEILDLPLHGVLHCNVHWCLNRHMYSTRAFCKKRPELQIWSLFFVIHR